MSYVPGGLIEATDYNGFVSSINSIWGIGTGDRGYGQSTTLSTVAATNTVTATQWATLISRIDSMRQHQSGVGSQLTQPSPGDVIEFLSNLSSRVTTITNNRLLNNEGLITAATANASGAWNGTVQADRQCRFTFASANQMRWFFNQGGQIVFNAANSSFSGNAKSNSWNSIATNLATQTINSANFYSLTTGFTTIASGTGAGADYNLNILYLQAALNAAPGSSTSITLRAHFVDGSVGIFDGTVFGTARIDATASRANVSFLTNTIGTVTGANNVVVTQS